MSVSLAPVGSGRPETAATPPTEARTVAVVPAYNEAETIGPVIDGTRDVVDQVLVVDDGSTDGTWQEITEHAEAYNATHPP